MLGDGGGGIYGGGFGLALAFGLCLGLAFGFGLAFAFGLCLGGGLVGASLWLACGAVSSSPVSSFVQGVFSDAHSSQKDGTVSAVIAFPQIVHLKTAILDFGFGGGLAGANLWDTCAAVSSSPDSSFIQGVFSDAHSLQKEGTESALTAFPHILHV